MIDGKLRDKYKSRNKIDRNYQKSSEMVKIAREINLNMKGVNFLSQKYTLKIIT
jgi:hypothetical protein